MSVEVRVEERVEVRAEVSVEVWVRLRLRVQARARAGAVPTAPIALTVTTNIIASVVSTVAGKADSLRAEGKQVVVVLATDGVPSNDSGYMNAQSKKDFQRALQTLQVGFVLCGGLRIAYCVLRFAFCVSCSMRGISTA